MAWLVFCSLLGVPAQAYGWIEKHIESSRVVVDVAPDGIATAQFSILLTVRGERLRGLTLHGIAPNAEALPEGSIARSQEGQPASLPLPLNVVADHGKLIIALPLNQGFSGRQFLLHFGYRTSLLQEGNLTVRSEEDLAEIAWTGPRYPNGVDGAQVVFRLPSSPIAPRIAQGFRHSTFGIVMSQLERSPTQDELQLVRAHLAQGESMVWRVLADRKLFPALDDGLGVPHRQARIQATPRARQPSPNPYDRDVTLWLVASLLGIGYALLVATKGQMVERLAAASNCAARAAVPAPLAFRAVAAGGLAAAATAIACFTESPAVASSLLLAAGTCALHLPFVPLPRLRASGNWSRVEKEELQFRPLNFGAPGWLDSSTREGRLFLALLLLSSTALASRLYATSPYGGACALAGTALLLPVFCTGLRRDLPLCRLVAARQLLPPIENLLRERVDWCTVPIGRITHTDHQLDELRLTVTPQCGVAGLKSLEVAVEIVPSWVGGHGAPVLLIRAVDNSPCYRALPRHWSWTRGRTDDERVAVIRPPNELPQTTARMIGEVLQTLQQKAPEPLKVSPVAPSDYSLSQKSQRSPGNSLSTEKPATSSSPLHAT